MAAGPGSAGVAAPDEEQGAGRPLVAGPDEPLTLKERIYQVTDVPSSSKLALFVSCFILACIIGSTVCFCLETLPSLRNYDWFWIYAEIFFITVFTTEYVTRFLVTPDSKFKFVTEPFNVVDLLAILPFFLEMLLAKSTVDLRILRIIRLVRLFRLFKVGKYSTNTQLIARAMSRSTEALLLLVFFLVVAMILFSTLMYTTEQGEWNDELGCHVRPGEQKCSPFQSVPHAFYWAITTMTTVGYGDVLPTTNVGKFICACTMVCGILVIALPITMIGNTFVEAYTEIHAEQKLKKVQEVMKDDHDIHRELFLCTQEIGDLKDEADGLLRELKQLLAATIVVNDDRTSAEALSTLMPSFDLLRAQEVQSLDDVCEYGKLSLPPHYK